MVALGAAKAPRSSMAISNLRIYSNTPDDGSGFKQPQYYETLSFANVDSDSAPELCGRGVFGILCGP